MPPRRRAAPPPKPSPTSPPQPDVNPGLTTDPEASSPGRGPDSAQPTISAAILANLPPKLRQVYTYRHVFAAGSMGMSVRGLSGATGLSSSAGGSQLRDLVGLGVLKEVQDVGLGVLKEVQDVRNRRRKLYMAAEFRPSDEVSGGTWYHDGRVDAAGRRRCLAQVKRLGAATADTIRRAGIARDEPTGAGYAMDRIADVLRIMVLDKSLEEVRSTGEGELAGVSRGEMCYREPEKQQPGGMMEAIPCGVCPVIDDCLPEGVISPSTCVYYQKWDFWPVSSPALCIAMALVGKFSFTVWACFTLL